MKKVITHEGQDYTLASITVEALEKVTMDGKEGRAWNAAMIAASLLSAGNNPEHATEEWVKKLAVFGPQEAGEPPFIQFLKAANYVNGFKAPDAKGEPGPAAPAAA